MIAKLNFFFFFFSIVFIIIKSIRLNFGLVLGRSLGRVGEEGSRHRVLDITVPVNSISGSSHKA